MTGDVHEGPAIDLPPVRIDWLADVAWRLAGLGLTRLRTSAQGELTLDDAVDGARWRARFMLDLIEPREGVVDLDADLWAPGDPDDTPSLRLGAALTPVIDDDGERAVQVRLEIGPRAAVTFDPENWIFTLPLAAILGGERPPVEGVMAGSLALGAEHQIGAGGSLGDLQAAVAVDLGDLIELAEGRTSWTTVIGLHATGGKRGLLARLGRERTAPLGTLTLEATGPLELGDPSGLLTGDGPERRAISAIRCSGDAAVIELAGDGPTPTTLTITGAHLQATVWLAAGQATADDSARERLA